MKPVIYVAMVCTTPVCPPDCMFDSFVKEGEDYNTPGGAEMVSVFKGFEAACAAVENKAFAQYDGKMPEKAEWTRADNTARSVLHLGTTIYGWVEPAWYDRRLNERRR